MEKRMKKNKLALALAIATGSYTVSTFAVEPLPIEVGAWDVTPSVSSSFSHSDNMFRSADNEVSTNLFIISPRVEATAGNDNSGITLVGQIDEANFSATSEDDYTDWLMGAAGYVGVGDNGRIDANISRFRTREMRGTGFSQGGFLPGVPDRYEETRVGAAFTLGTNQSFGRLILSADNYDKSYRNNRLTTQYRDREDMQFGSTFLVNLSDRTALLFEYIDRDVDYGTDPTGVAGFTGSLDSKEKYYYVGATWEITGATTGSVRVGQGEKDFKDRNRQNADMTSYVLDLNWAPLDYSVVNLTANRVYDEAVGFGDAVLARNVGANWQHEWNNQLRSTVHFRDGKQDHLTAQRNDDVRDYGVRVDYSVKRWFDVFALFSYDERKSNFGNFSYEQNMFTLGVNASL
jgi:polysaccharide biosynthesis protein VpsM